MILLIEITDDFAGEVGSRDFSLVGGGYAQNGASYGTHILAEIATDGVHLLYNGERA